MPSILQGAGETQGQISGRPWCSDGGNLPCSGEPWPRCLHTLNQCTRRFGITLPSAQMSKHRERGSYLKILFLFRAQVSSIKLEDLRHSPEHCPGEKWSNNFSQTQMGNPFIHDVRWWGLGEWKLHLLLPRRINSPSMRRLTVLSQGAFSIFLLQPRHGKLALQISGITTSTWEEAACTLIPLPRHVNLF